MIRPSAVLFDCDAVIVDSEGPTFDLLVEDLATHGLTLTRAPHHPRGAAKVPPRKRNSAAARRPV